VVTTFTQGYDGDGELISAVTAPSGSSSTVGYDIRSSVLGTVLTELDQSGNKRSTHVSADALLFASQNINSTGAWVSSTIRNPVGTGERGGSIYDPLGNYIPFQQYNDPRPPAGSYNSGSMSSLTRNQANPDSYGVGCRIDGVPTSCNRVLQAINNGEAKTLVLYGATVDVALANMGFFLVKRPVWLKNEVVWRHSLFAFIQPQNPLDEPAIEKAVLDALADVACKDFADTVLSAQSRRGLGTLSDVAKSFFALGGPHFTRKRPADSTLGISNPIGRISSRNAKIYSLGNDASLTPGEQMLNDADNAISELFHLAAQGAYYSDEELATAVHNSAFGADAYSLMSNGQPLIDPRSNIFDSRYIPNKKDKYDREHSFSRYFHAIQRKYCTSKPGFERGVGYQP
jgi:hypothetical protein